MRRYRRHQPSEPDVQLTSAFDLVLLVACALFLCGRVEPAAAVESTDPTRRTADEAAGTPGEWRPLARFPFDAARPDAALESPEGRRLRIEDPAKFRHLEKLMAYCRSKGIDIWQQDARPAPTTEN